MRAAIGAEMMGIQMRGIELMFSGNFSAPPPLCARYFFSQEENEYPRAEARRRREKKGAKAWSEVVSKN
jgi:hypothetical protein